MNAFFRGIFEAKNLGMDYLIVICGIGKGILKKKIIEFLNQTREIYGDEINIEKSNKNRIFSKI